MSSTLEQLYRTSHLFGGNASYIETWYETWLQNPQDDWGMNMGIMIKPDQWRQFFESMPVPAEPESGHLEVAERFRQMATRPAGYSTGSTEFTEHKQAGVSRLVNSYRIRGHEVARLDPLGKAHHAPADDLELDFHDLDATDLEHEFDTGSLAAPPRMKLKDILELVKRVYCNSIGVEYMHIVDTAKRDWLRQRLEGSQGFYDIDDAERKRVLQGNLILPILLRFQR